MKPLFYLLVFANIAFLGWKLFIGDPARELPVVTRGPGIPVLKLAVERRTDALLFSRKFVVGKRVSCGAACCLPLSAAALWSWLMHPMDSAGLSV